MWVERDCGGRNCISKCWGEEHGWEDPIVCSPTRPVFAKLEDGERMLGPVAEFLVITGLGLANVMVLSGLGIAYCLWRKKKAKENSEEGFYFCEACSRVRVSDGMKNPFNPKF